MQAMNQNVKNARNRNNRHLYTHTIFVNYHIELSFKTKKPFRMIVTNESKQLVMRHKKNFNKAIDNKMN